MVLGTSVAVMEVVLVGMMTLAMEDTSVVEVTLVAVALVEDMLPVGKAIMGLVMMKEAHLEVAEATVILAMTTTNLQIVEP